MSKKYDFFEETSHTQQGESNTLPKKTMEKIKKIKIQESKTSNLQSHTQQRESNTQQLYNKIVQLEKLFLNHISQSHTQQGESNTLQITDLTINKFMSWILKLIPDQYPGQAQLLKQTQKYKKKALYSDVLQLFRIFLETQGSERNG